MTGPLDGQGDAGRSWRFWGKLAIGCLASVLAVAVAFLIYQIISYNREYDALASAIESNDGIEVLDSWRHEDITLEDFGFTFRTPQGRTARIDIMDGGRVRTPEDEALGVFVTYRVNGKRVGSLIPFEDRLFWDSVAEEDLRTIADLLPHLDAFLRRCESYEIGKEEVEWDRSLDYIWLRSEIEIEQAVPRKRAGKRGSH